MKIRASARSRFKTQSHVLLHTLLAIKALVLLTPSQSPTSSMAASMRISLSFKTASRKRAKRSLVGRSMPLSQTPGTASCSQVIVKRDTSMVTTGSSNTTFGLPPLLASETWPCCGSQPQTGSPRSTSSTGRDNLQLICILKASPLSHR